MKKLMLLAGIFAFLLSSCDLFGETDPIDEDGVVKKNFKAQSFKNGSFYSLEAGKLAENTRCTVWVERGAGITKETAQKVASEYSNNIYQKMISNFVTNKDGFNFETELADINSDGKLVILLLDIRDNYQKGVNESAVGGYFLWSDLFPNEANSNGLAMIYIDTNPGIPGGTESNKTLAHEMQHLINEVTSQVLRYNGSQYLEMDTWIDEGLSCAAEWVYSGSHPTDRYGWYNNNGNGRGLINKGNNFYVWGNRSTESQYAEIDDYATAYLFFQWLRLQSSNGAGIYKDIIGSASNNYQAVTSAASSRINASYSNNWGGLLRDWLAANYINASNGRYGYGTELRTLNKHLLTTKGTTPLYPGEGVFSKIDQAYVDAGNKPGDAGNIKYSILTTAPQDTLAVGALLAYNTNTVNTANTPSANGTLTGVPASISAGVSVDGRFVSPPVALSGPYWVSGGDVLRRNGMAVSPAGVSRPLIRVAR